VVAAGGAATPRIAGSGGAIEEGTQPGLVALLSGKKKSSGIKPMLHEAGKSWIKHEKNHEK